MFGTRSTRKSLPAQWPRKTAKQPKQEAPLSILFALPPSPRCNPESRGSARQRPAAGFLTVVREHGRCLVRRSHPGFRGPEVSPLQGRSCQANLARRHARRHELATATVARSSWDGDHDFRGKISRNAPANPLVKSSQSVVRAFRAAVPRIGRGDRPFGSVAS